MKTFASAVAGVQGDLDDRGRDEALCFAASVASRKGDAKPATYQTACPDQFEKILAAAGLKSGRDYVMKTKPGHPGLVTWQPTGDTTRFLSSVRAAPAFETLVAAADGEPAEDAPPVPVYSGEPPLGPESLWNALGRALEGNPSVPRVVREIVESRMVAGHKVVLPPVWVIEQLVAPMHQARIDGAPLHTLKPFDPDCRNVLEVPIVRHVKAHETLYGLGLLVEMPPVDMYFRPPTTGDGSNPLQGYFYQDADMAADADNPNALIVASSALLDLTGPQCVQVAAALADGPRAIAKYLANLFTTAFNLNAKVLRISVRSRRACNVDSVPEAVFRVSANPFTSSLAYEDVVVNFVLRLTPSYRSPASASVPELLLANPRPAPRFAGYVPPFAQPPPRNLAFTRGDFGTMWRFALKFWESDRGFPTVSSMSGWLDQHPSASIEAAPVFTRAKFVQFTFLSQLRSVWQASGKPLVVMPGKPPDIIRGVFPMMLAQTDLGWATGRGVLLDATVGAGVLDADGSSDTWKDFLAVPDGDLIPVIVFATNIPADATTDDALDKLRKRLELQAYRAFFNNDKTIVSSTDPVNLVSHRTLNNHFASAVATWVCPTRDFVGAFGVHVEFKTDPHGRLVVLLAFIGSAGRLALALSANACSVAEEFMTVVLTAAEPVTVRARGPGDAGAARDFVGVLVQQGMVDPMVGDHVIGPGPATAAVSRRKYLETGDVYQNN